MADKPKSKWISGAVKHPGAERRAAARAGMSTHAYMEKHKDDSGTAGERARLGLTLSGMHHGARNKPASIFGKGYASGGEVKETKAQQEKQQQEEDNWNAFLMEQARQNALEGKGANPYPDEAKARGGKIKKVAGKPIGRDDGLIPAQRGEYVIRKSAVKKLGTAVLDQVNQGRLPRNKPQTLFNRSR